MTLSIAVAGKGGVGKTTLAALMVRALHEQAVRPILAVDADPNSNLAEALGVPPGRPLADIREQGSLPEGSPASGIGRARALDDEIQRAITEAEGFDLLTMGRPEGPRCYCYVNHLLRKSLDKLGQNYAAVVLDNEAGMEHLSRRTTQDVDFLIAVTDPTLPAFRAAQRILALAHELPVRIGRRLVVINRVEADRPPIEIRRRLAELRLECLPEIPEDAAVERAGVEGADVFGLPNHCSALHAVHRLVAALRSGGTPSAPLGPYEPAHREK